MKKIKPLYLTCFLLLFFTFGIQSCTTQKSTIIVNKKVITKKYGNHQSNNNILYLIGEKKVSDQYVKKLKPKNIASITVIKNKKEVAKYTTKKYDGVIIIKMKK